MPVDGGGASATDSASPETSHDRGGSEDVHDVVMTDENPKANVDSATQELNTEKAGDEEAQDEATALKGLTADVRDQDDLERDITYQANIALIEHEDERDKKRIEKAIASRDKLRAQKITQNRRLKNAANNPVLKDRIQKEVDRLAAEIASFDEDIKQLQERIDDRHKNEEAEAPSEDSSNRRLPNETQREFLIRTGKITPFARLPGQEAQHGGDFSGAIADAEADAEAEQTAVTHETEQRSHQNLRMPGFAEVEAEAIGDSNAESEATPPRRKKRRTATGRSSRVIEDDSDEFTPNAVEESEAGEEEDDDDFQDSDVGRKRKSVVKSKDNEEKQTVVIDDGNEKVYQARLNDWVKRRSKARRLNRAKRSATGDADGGESDPEEEEWFKPSPTTPDKQFENGIKLPGDIYPSLFDYQLTCVQWLGELYSQQVGGILGDEMGLGKTIQVISFLAALHYSKKLTKPAIVVAPATVLKQWVNEFHKWWPPLRVSILHTSGSGMLNIQREDQTDDEVFTGHRYDQQSRSPKAARRILDRVLKHGHVLVTTYAGLQTYGDILLPIDWGYAVLDEGHKIRNPNTAITVYCKELRTSNRLILSGTPMQNNLIELWSLFDFIYPMRLGTLVNFRNQFEVPIKIGGYASATNLQIMTATKCAETLKDAISPYLLQRLKADVASDLPKKSEQVLFCKLTKPQREQYEQFLNSNEMQSILAGKRQSLYGIDILRKICNHPDLTNPAGKGKPGLKWGHPNKSGKMQVVKALLEMWKKFGHKTLLFCQGVQMLNIIEEFVQKLGGFNYLRMDGTTPIKDRQLMVDKFNRDPDLHVFLLTTKVGGLGVNLTGADRVLIYDPDWNPSTDMQARERAWRLGQKKEVTIYRLMTAGTIEEKIYHRQIFKQFLTNKILKDPKQRQSFQLSDLYDLFSLGSPEDGKTETGEMFKGTEVKFDKEDSAEQDGADSEGQGDSDIALRNLTGVAGMESYQNTDDEEKPTTDEGRLMEGIFARSGVHSALEHDQIVNGKKVVAADRNILEREAKRVAAEAAAELRRAGEAARSVPIGTVTWTGQVGEAGRPSNMRRGGLESSSVLANLAARQNLSRSQSRSRSNTPAGGAAGGPRGKEWVKLIRDFITAQGGSVPSQSLVVHFNNMCQTPQQTAEFKASLQQIAKLEKSASTRMRGRWVLRDEYRKRTTT